MIRRFVCYKQRKCIQLIREQKLSSKKYLDYIRKQPCLVCGLQPCDPDHLEARGMGGAGTEKKDYSCVPLCRIHHSERHQAGNEKFENKYGINLWKDAFNLIRRYFAEK